METVAPGNAPTRNGSGGEDASLATGPDHRASKRTTRPENLYSPMDDCLFCNGTSITEEEGKRMDSLMGLEGESG